MPATLALLVVVVTVDRYGSNDHRLNDYSTTAYFLILLSVIINTLFTVGIVGMID